MQPRVDIGEGSSLTILISILLSANWLKISVSIGQSNVRLSEGEEIEVVAGGNDGVSPRQVHPPSPHS